MRRSVGARTVTTRLLSCVAVMAVMAAGCGDDDDDATSTVAATQPSGSTIVETSQPPEDGGGDAESDEPIVIGASLGLTGAYSIIGKESEAGYLAAAEWINENEGGVLGRPLKVVVVDNESDARVAADSVTRLVERDGADLLIVDGTPTTAAAIPVAKGLQVPLLSTGGGWPYGYTAEDLQWAFGIANLAAQLDNYVELWKSEGITKVAAIGADTPLTGVVTNYFEKGRGKDSGITLTTFEKFPPGSTDLTAAVVSVERSGAEFILSWTTGPDQGTTLSTIDRLGVDLPVGLIGGTTSQAFVALVGGPEKLDGVYSQAYSAQLYSFLPESRMKEEITSYFEAMEQQGIDHKNGTSNAAIGWDAVRLLADAIEAAGTTEPGAVRDALETQETVTMIAGVIKRGPDDHVGAGTGQQTAVFDSDAFGKDPSAGWVPVDEITLEDLGEA